MCVLCVSRRVTRTCAPFKSPATVTAYAPPFLSHSRSGMPSGGIGGGGGGSGGGTVTGLEHRARALRNSTSYRTGGGSIGTNGGGGRALLGTHDSAWPYRLILVVRVQHWSTSLLGSASRAPW